jgi:hypothetical protein
MPHQQSWPAQLPLLQHRLLNWSYNDVAFNELLLGLAFLGGCASAFFFFGTACAPAISFRARAICSSRYDLNQHHTHSSAPQPVAHAVRCCMSRISHFSASAEARLQRMLDVVSLQHHAARQSTATSYRHMSDCLALGSRPSQPYILLIP